MVLNKYEFELAIPAEEVGMKTGRWNTYAAVV
jgi:hypothetical protein